MAEARDPFAILGIPHDADDQAVKAAYRRLVKEVHPDVAGKDGLASSGGDQDRFRDVKWAYDQLKEPSSRQRAAERHRAPVRSASISTAFDSFFQDVDRHGRGGAIPSSRTKSTPGGNVELEISLEDAFVGGRFHIHRDGGKCEECQGAGRVRSPRPVPCPDCQGVGSTRTVQGFITITNECPTCTGTGFSMFRSCLGCGGDGAGDGLDLDVTLPQGCRDGYRLTPAGFGGIQIVVRIREHPVFTRDIEDLHAVVEIPVWAAVLGHTVVLRGVDGADERIVIPPGTWHGAEIILPEKGMPAFPGRGLLVVSIEVAMPSATGEIRSLLERMRDLDALGKPKP